MDCDCLLPSIAEQCWCRHFRAQGAFSLQKTCRLPIARLCQKSKCYCHVESLICLHWAAHNELYNSAASDVKNWQTCHALKISCLSNIILILIKSKMFWLNFKWSWFIIHHRCNYHLSRLNSYKKVIYMVLNYWILHSPSHVWMNTHHMVTQTVAKKHSWNTLKFHTDVNTYTCNTTRLTIN